MTESTTLYFIRHGQTEYNSEKIIQGWLDVPLCENGKAQAELLGRRLRTYGVDLIITSDLVRALKTSEIINAYLSLPLIIDNRWREVNLGEWQGITWEQIIKKNPGARDDYIKNWLCYKKHGGEAWEDVYHRVSSGFDEIAKTYDGKKIAIVTHGGAIRIALIHALKWPKQHHRLIFDNTSITELVYNENNWWLKRMNDFAHLDFHDWKSLKGAICEYGNNILSAE